MPMRRTPPPARLVDRLTWRVPGAVPQQQFGAIPYALVDDHVAFLLITSRRTGRWIFPKGTIETDAHGADVAAQEAWEEAGVSGRIERDSIGTYMDWKIRGFRRLPVQVAMYPLLVETQHDDWKESHQRHRHWAILPEARRLLTHPGLIEMVTRIDARYRNAGQPSVAKASAK